MESKTTPNGVVTYPKLELKTTQNGDETTANGVAGTPTRKHLRHLQLHVDLKQQELEQTKADKLIL